MRRAATGAGRGASDLGFAFMAAEYVNWGFECTLPSNIKKTDRWIIGWVDWWMHGFDPTPLPARSWLHPDGTAGKRRERRGRRRQPDFTATRFGATTLTGRKPGRKVTHGRVFRPVLEVKPLLLNPLPWSDQDSLVWSRVPFRSAGSKRPTRMHEDSQRPWLVPSSLI